MRHGSKSEAWAVSDRANKPATREIVVTSARRKTLLHAYREWFLSADRGRPLGLSVSDLAAPRYHSQVGPSIWDAKRLADIVEEGKPVGLR